MLKNQQRKVKQLKRDKSNKKIKIKSKLHINFKK